jgi:hypothetical protein
MPEVSIYVAIVSAGAAVLGAAVSPISTSYQNVRQARRDRMERRETEIRQACTGLIRSARDLGVAVANNHAYQGEDIGSRLERVRQLAADAALHADSVALLVPQELASCAAELAAAVGRLAGAAEANIDSRVRRSIRDPDFTELNHCIVDFSKQAAKYMADKFSG